MILGLSYLEIGIILVVLILLFGVGRITRLGGEFGSAIKNFRKNVSSDDHPNKDDADKSLK